MFCLIKLLGSLIVLRIKCKIHRNRTDNSPMVSCILLISVSGLTPEPPQLISRTCLFARESFCALPVVKKFQGATYLMALANATKDDAGFPPALCTRQL